MGICKKMRKKKKRKEKKQKQSNGRKLKTQCDLPFLHASAILFSSVPVHLCVVNSTVNEWSDSLVVCATSCEVTASHPSLAYIVSQPLECRSRSAGLGSVSRPSEDKRCCRLNAQLVQLTQRDAGRLDMLKQRSFYSQRIFSSASIFKERRTVMFFHRPIPKLGSVST